MSDLTNSILETWLPSKWPRLIMGSSISLSLGILFLPEWSQKIGLQLTEKEIALFRIGGIPWLLLFALALTHFLILRERKSFENLKNYKIHKKITLEIGEYYELEGIGFPIKITLKNISIENMPSPHEATPKSPSNYVELESATLSFSPSFYFRYGSNCIKKHQYPKDLSEESFIMSKYQGSDEDSSVFFFNIENSINGGIFFRCFISHINPNKQQVELDVFFLRLQT